ncbi:methyltransferase protein, partial [Nowakowskiella sp. JEL0078]
MTGTHTNFARALQSTISNLNYSEPVLRMPFAEPDAWTRYNEIRTFCEHTPRLALALVFPSELPVTLDDDLWVDQWIAEPVRFLVLPCNLFLKNAKGFPVLSKRVQALVVRFLKFSPQFVISAAAVEGEHPSGGLAAYHQYLRHLAKQQPELGIVDQFATGYHDYLQAPLQPLMDHLESATYEVFEQDPVKYRLYETAVEYALADRSHMDVIVLMVVGAGRGPLVDCSLRAASKLGANVRMYAVEKNPNAIVT